MCINAAGVESQHPSASLTASGLESAPTVGDAVAYCQNLSAIAATLALTHADEQQLRSLLSSIRSSESALAALSAKIADRVTTLAEDGNAPPPREFLLGDGTGTTGRGAGAEAARAEALRLVPALRTPLTEGLTSPHHVDAVARQLLPLTPGQLAHLNLDELVRAATDLPADTFNVRLRRMIAALPSSNGQPSPAERERAASSFRHWVDNETGMGCFFGQFDRETLRSVRLGDRPTYGTACRRGRWQDSEERQPRGGGPVRSHHQDSRRLATEHSSHLDCAHSRRWPDQRRPRPRR